MRLLSKFVLPTMSEFPNRISYNGNRIMMCNSSRMYVFSACGELIKDSSMDCHAACLLPNGFVKIVRDLASNTYHAIIFNDNNRVVNYLKAPNPPIVGTDGSIAFFDFENRNFDGVTIVLPPDYEQHMHIKTGERMRLAIYNKDIISFMSGWPSKTGSTVDVITIRGSHKYRARLRLKGFSYPARLRFCGHNGECLILDANNHLLNANSSYVSSLGCAAMFFDSASGKLRVRKNCMRPLLFNVGRYLVSQSYSRAEDRCSLDLISGNVSIPIYELEKAYICDTFGTVAVIITTNHMVYVFDTTYDKQFEDRLVTSAIKNIDG